MGKFIAIECKCGAKHNLSTGIFFLGPTEEDAYNEIMNNSQYESLRQYVSSPKDIANDFDKRNFPIYNLFYCNKCHYLYSLLDFQLVNSAISVVHKCEFCNSKLTNLGQSYEKVFSKEIKVSCPNCKADDILNDDNSNLDFGWAD